MVKSITLVEAVRHLEARIEMKRQHRNLSWSHLDTEALRRVLSELTTAQAVQSDDKREHE